jgi:hypothetical protein
MRGVWVLGCLAVVGCDGGGDDDDGGKDDDDLAIAGTYVDDFGVEHHISNEAWEQTYPDDGGQEVFHIVAWDNSERRVVAHNALENAYNGNLFSAFDWAEDGDGLYVCQTRYDAATQDEAAQAPRADDSDPATGGCGGETFAWTNLTP